MYVMWVIALTKTVSIDKFLRQAPAASKNQEWLNGTYINDVTFSGGGEGGGSHLQKILSKLVQTWLKFTKSSF